MSEKLFIVGVCGPKRSGKSTFADRLVERHEFVRVRFAEGLKNMLRALPGVTEEHTDGALKEEPCDALSGATPRHVMQVLGTDCMRRLVHPEFWVNAWRARVTELVAAGRRRIVVDDVRFPNEARAVHAFGRRQLIVNNTEARSVVGEIVEIRREGHDYVPRPSRLRSLAKRCAFGLLDRILQDGHASEFGLPRALIDCELWPAEGLDAVAAAADEFASGRWA